MKKLDKLILLSFVSPLILTFLVIVFILLTKQMFYYFDDIIGKDLGVIVVLQFLLYFAILMLPAAMPLSILLASLITFGNLSEHFELTAIKATGIALPRVLLPIFVFVIFLTGAAFYTNNYLVPKAALEAYTLLYDIRKKKPTLDIREGVFYNGLPDISIKVNRKFPQDDAALKDIMLYDHSGDDGGTEVLLADSGRMSTILNERYLKFEFFNGYQYTEYKNGLPMAHEKNSSSNTLTRKKFLRAELITDLSSFDLTKTDRKIFENNRLMRNLRELDGDIDSMRRMIITQQPDHTLFTSGQNYFLKEGRRPQQYTSSTLPGNIDSLVKATAKFETIQAATNTARQVKDKLQSIHVAAEHSEKELMGFQLQWHRIPASSIACIVMFLIGAPLGALIKRGGLGVPFLISILFFIIYTIMNMQGEKLAKQQYFSVLAGSWLANAVLLAIGLIFLRSARNDASLFEGAFWKTLLKK